MKFLLISPKNRTVYNFRGDLIKAIIALGYDVIVTGPDDSNVDKIEKLGARFTEIPMNKTGTSISADLAYCKALTKLMKKEQPDVVLAYTSKPVIYGTIAAKRTGIKNINCLITGAGYTFTAKKGKAKILGSIVKTLYKYALAKADNVIFQNPDDRDEFTKLGLVNASKTHVVNGSGVNMEHFKKEDFPEKITLFMLSRLLKSKGVREYLEAARIVKKRHPKVQFKLLGKYEYEMQDAIPQDEIEQYIRDGIVERYEETDDVRVYYRDCSIYVLPSYREGTPRTVLEAMSTGRAIITTDTNGCRETVIAGVNGFLVPIRNAQAVADAMEKFIENPELIKQMGDKSIELCRNKFEVSKVNEQMIRIMQI